MTYIVKAYMYVPFEIDPDNPTFDEFWEKVGLVNKTVSPKQNKYEIENYSSEKAKEQFKSIKALYSDRAGDPNVIKLEFDTQPEVFSDLERAGLKIGPSEDVEVSVDTISELGVTLFLEYYPYEEGKSLSGFNGNIFIPMHRVVSINALYNGIIDSVYANKAILNGDVKSTQEDG